MRNPKPLDSRAGVDDRQSTSTLRHLSPSIAFYRRQATFFTRDVPALTKIIGLRYRSARRYTRSHTGNCYRHGAKRKTLALRTYPDVPVARAVATSGAPAIACSGCRSVAQ